MTIEIEIPDTVELEGIAGRSDYLTDRYSRSDEWALKAIDRHIAKI